MTTSRRFFCDTAMGQVHGVESGSGGGAPLVLLHQTPRSADEFKEVLPLLARHRRTIAIDSPGYGCSDPVEGQPTVGQYARAVVDVLDALKIDRAVFVGHHTGAVISVELAAAFPDREVFGASHLQQARPVRGSGQVETGPRRLPAGDRGLPRCRCVRGEREAGAFRPGRPRLRAVARAQ